MEELEDIQHELKPHPWGAGILVSLLLPETKVPHQIAITTTLTAWSGVDTAIKSVALLVTEFPDIRLVIAGEGFFPRRLAE